MKRIALICFALVGLAGCATSSDPSTRRAAMVTDHERMAAIERAAATTGVRVIWIRAPQKPAVPSGG